VGLGQSLKAMIRPALLVGPFMGVLGGLFLIALMLFGPGGGGAGIAIIAMFVGSILGLIVATPVAFVAGTLLLRMAAWDSRWASRPTWGGTGLVIGATIGAVLGIVGTDAVGWVVTVAVLAILGAIGALLCRSMVDDKLANSSDIDADIFA
jgi:hypothetical protein